MSDKEIFYRFQHLNQAKVDPLDKLKIRAFQQCEDKYLINLKSSDKTYEILEAELID